MNDVGQVKTRGATIAKWAFAIVPAIGLFELAAHAWQTTHVVSDADWTAARDAVKGMAKPDDLVVFAPRWSDPLGRRSFGPEIATLDREAFPDVSRFPRAIEVSIRGQHAPELDGWRTVGEQKVGAITLRTLENPTKVTIVDDLLRHVNADGARVTRVDQGREAECPFNHGSPQAGGLGFGMGIPGDKFVCPSGGFVGLSVVPDLDYRPHRCIYAPPQGGGSAIRVRFANVAFGQYLHGHHGLYVEAERHRDGAPVSLVWRAGDRTIGSLVHTDGDGWKGFDLPTTDLAGTRGDLVAEVSASSGARRIYCFEADTR